MLQALRSDSRPQNLTHRGGSSCGNVSANQCLMELDGLCDSIAHARLCGREAADEATLAVEARVQTLRESVENLLNVPMSVCCGAIVQDFAAKAQAFDKLLEDERHHRQERYTALADVVNLTCACIGSL